VKQIMTNVIYLTQVSVAIILVSFLLPSQSYGQTEQDQASIISKLLVHENVDNFLVNQGDNNVFASNFQNISNLKPSQRDVLIKADSELIIAGEKLQEFSTILIEGTLRIYGTDEFPLRVQKIIVTPTGKLIIGTDEQPIYRGRNVEIIFVNNQQGDIGIFVLGELKIHGHDIGPTFAKLVANADPGKSEIAVDTSIKKWKEGDKIVITSSLTAKERKCTEESEVLHAVGSFLTLKKPLRCFHYGAFDNINAPPSHVSSLTRNVVITSDDLGSRGFVKFFYGSYGYVKFAEFRDLGQKKCYGGGILFIFIVWVILQEEFR